MAKTHSLELTTLPNNPTLAIEYQGFVKHTLGDPKKDQLRWHRHIQRQFINLSFGEDKDEVSDLSLAYRCLKTHQKRILLRHLQLQGVSLVHSVERRRLIRGL
jgi:hypothetical protein